MSINNEQLIASFTAFATSQNIDKPTLMRLLDDVLRSLVAKKFGDNTNVDIIINPNKGDLQVWRYRKIVADDDSAKDDPANISLSEACKIETDFEVGEEMAEEVALGSFSRRDITQGFHLLVQNRKIIDQGNFYKKYKGLIGEVLTLEVYYASGKEAVLHDEDKNEFHLPRTQQLPRDYFKRGQHVRAILHNIVFLNNKPCIILSRTSPQFVAKLLELDIPEIADDIITIEKVVRRPGERSKVVVNTYGDYRDPVGACIGHKGSRIKNVSKEIGYEQIDILRHSDNPEILLSRALSPANISTLSQNNGRLEVYLPSDQVPIAIGVRGQNIDLASQLIDMPIDIFREINAASKEDILLEEFGDEVAQETLQKIKALDITTAQQFLDKSLATLAQETSIPLEELQKIRVLIQAEFDNGPLPSSATTKEDIPAVTEKA